MTCVPSEYSDQPGHPPSLITESIRCPHEESLGPELLIEHTAETLIRLGDLCWAHRSFCRFYHKVVYMFVEVPMTARTDRSGHTQVHVRLLF